MRRLKALILKEFYQIIRDPSSIMIAFILPFILLFIFGYGVSLDANEIDIGVVVQDSSPEIQSLISSFKHTRFLKAEISKDLKTIENKVVAGKLRGMVVIPSDFTWKLKNSYDTAEIQVIADGSEPNTASFVQNYVRGVYSTWLQQENITTASQHTNNVSIQTRYWYNPELKSSYFLLPGSIAIIMTLIGTLLTSLVIAREWERGSMEALMATPVNIIEIILGKLVPYFILGMTSLVICTAVSIFIFGVPFRGSFLLLGFVSSVFLITALEQGLLISTVTKNQFLASQLALISGFLPSFILSGFVFEINSMPLFVQAITCVVPAKYFVTCLQTLFLAGDIYELIIPNVFAILALGLILFILITMKTRKRLM